MRSGLVGGAGGLRGGGIGGTRLESRALPTLTAYLLPPMTRLPRQRIT